MLKIRILKGNNIGTHIRAIEQLNWNISNAYVLLKPSDIDKDDLDIPPFKSQSHKFAMEQLLGSLQDYRKYFIKKAIKLMEEKINGKKKTRRWKIPNFRKD